MTESTRTTSRDAHYRTKAGQPYQRIVHLAQGVRDDGAVSAACFKSPRAIDMRRASWVLRPEAVTCPKCKAVADDR